MTAALGACLSVLTFLSGPFLLFGPTVAQAQFTVDETPMILARVSGGGGSGGGGTGGNGDGTGGSGDGTGGNGDGTGGNGDGTGGNGDGTGGNGDGTGGNGDGTGGNGDGTGGNGDGTGGNGDGTGGNGDGTGGNGDGTGGNGDGTGGNGDGTGGNGDGTGGNGDGTGGNGDGTGGNGDGTGGNGDGTGGNGDGTGGNGDGTGGNGDGTGGNGDGTGGNGDGTGGNGDGTGGNGDGTGGNGDGTGGNGDGTGGNGDGTGGNGDGTGGNGDGTGGNGDGTGGNGDGTGGNGDGPDGNGDGTGGNGDGTGGNGDGTGGNGDGTGGNGDGTGGNGDGNTGQGIFSAGGGADGNGDSTGLPGRRAGTTPSQPQGGTTFRSTRETGGPVVTVRGSGNPEVVVIGPARQSQAAVDALAEVGARFLRTKQLGSMGLQVLIFEYPRGRQITAINEALRAAAPDMDAAYHNIYEFAQFAPRTYAPDLVAQGAPNGCRVPRNVRIGMIDGPVNAAHPALAGAKIRTHSLLSAQERSVGAAHGTGVAALMVGEDPRGYFSGFAQGAELFSVAIFTSRLGGERTNVERIAGALDYLLARDVRLINMSFTGPNNNVLRIVLEAASSAGAVMVAAVGTDGIPGGSLPAASEYVIGVTAVDSRLRRFGAANSGPQVEFAAPGVDLYVAKAQGGRYATGTSFAAPIVTAIVAGMTARGARGLAQIRARLKANAQDLGAAGRDDTFGHGLVRASNC
ncbi:S8 family serine peptidase [Sulfitobacter sp. JB4-11]|uniref:S8 family serine peptidase n=1 Tax=Sulfitobacter rhodophyticola TaxID=3238304 RepID=UPI003D81C1F6